MSLPKILKTKGEKNQHEMSNITTNQKTSKMRMISYEKRRENSLLPSSMQNEYLPQRT